jgi:hypothetical protein
MTTIKFSNRAADCTIEQYMACKFDDNKKALIIAGEPTAEQLAKAWETIETEFIDLSGTMIHELDIMKQIKALECDIEAIKCFVFVQREWVRNFNKPHLENMAMLNKDYRAALKWDEEKPDAEAFLKAIDRFVTSTSNKTVKLKQREKELADLHKKQKSEPTINNSRKVFISTLIEIGKFVGYHIDRNKTMVEELAVMIFNQAEYAKQLEMNMTKN